MEDLTAWEGEGNQTQTHSGSNSRPPLWRRLTEHCSFHSHDMPKRRPDENQTGEKKKKLHKKRQTDQEAKLYKPRQDNKTGSQQQRRQQDRPRIKDSKTRHTCDCLVFSRHQIDNRQNKQQCMTKKQQTRQGENGNIELWHMPLSCLV
jgi:hypothetical protein